MKLDEIKLLTGENSHQIAEFELNDKMVDYELSKSLTYSEFMSVLKGLDIISEFYDVKATCVLKGTNICAVALGQSQADSVQKSIDCNPIDFINSVIVMSSEVDSETAKFFKESNILVAPKYTRKALEYLDTHNITYITINTPLKDYKKYVEKKVLVTPLGTFIQTPNLSELDKDKFKVVSKQKPTVEQIEDAVFAWKVAKHCKTQGIVIAKDLKTSAISQGLQSASVEFVLDYSCDLSKDAILASDCDLTSHDIDVASQGRISLIIVPFADNSIISKADKYNMGVIETGVTNNLF